MSESVTPLSLDPPLVAEDQGRAGYYALLARLYYAGPDAALLAAIAGADEIPGEEPSALASAWRALAAAARAMDAEAAALEYDEVFVGTGKAEVTPYLSHYILQRSTDNPLVELRQQLAAWGIGRREEVPEYEDHISGICETMRFAIAVQHRSPEEQKDYFERFVYRGAMAFCDAVSASPNARFYRLVAQFARAFLTSRRLLSRWWIEYQ